MSSIQDQRANSIVSLRNYEAAKAAAAKKSAQYAPVVESAVQVEKEHERERESEVSVSARRLYEQAKEHTHEAGE
jgi:hypothetical protein